MLVGAIFVYVWPAWVRDSGRRRIMRKAKSAVSAHGYAVAVVPLFLKFWLFRTSALVRVIPLACLMSTSRRFRFAFWLVAYADTMRISLLFVYAQDFLCTVVTCLVASTIYRVGPRKRVITSWACVWAPIVPFVQSTMHLTALA